MGSVEARILHAEALMDAVISAHEHGTDHELALALRDWLRSGIMQHSWTDGHPVSRDTATAIAGNLAGGLAFMLRGAK